MSHRPANFMSRLTQEQATALRLAAYKKDLAPGALTRLVITDWLEHEGWLRRAQRELADSENDGANSVAAE